MTARTRTEALCLEAAERDMRSATWSEIDALSRRIGELSGVRRFERLPVLVTRKVALPSFVMTDCALCYRRPSDCECDPDASWEATYAAFKRERQP